MHSKFRKFWVSWNFQNCQKMSVFARKSPFCCITIDFLRQKCLGFIKLKPVFFPKNDNSVFEGLPMTIYRNWNSDVRCALVCDGFYSVRFIICHWITPGLILSLQIALCKRRKYTWEQNFPVDQSSGTTLYPIYVWKT